MDFLNFFGLKEDPFKLTPDPAYFYPSSSHNEGLLLLDYSTEQKEGFCLILGDPGTGKTTLLNVFLEKWKSAAEIAIILTPRLSPEEFLVSVVEDLSINPGTENKHEIIKTLRDFMIEKSGQDRRVIIIVDEAQNLPDETLEELRLLSNLETDKDKLLQIILIGQPELETRLVTDRLRQLNQRITTRIRLRQFSPEEALDYINCRLIKAGKKNLKIQRGAERLVHKLSHGVPRLINMLMSRALMAAYLEESHVILPRHLDHAVKSLGHDEIRLQKNKILLPLSSGALLVLLAAAAGYFYLQFAHTGVSTTEHVLQKMSNRPGETSSGAEPTVDHASSSAGLCEEETAWDARAGFKFISVTVPSAGITDTPSHDARSVAWTSRGSSFVVLDESADSHDVTWYQILHRGKKRWISEETVAVAELE